MYWVSVIHKDGSTTVVHRDSMRNVRVFIAEFGEDVFSIDVLHRDYVLGELGSDAAAHYFDGETGLAT